MRKRSLVLVSLGALLMAQGCATVGREPAKIVAAGPRISKTLSVNPQQRFLKRKVAIARFSDETKYGQGFFHDLHNDRIGKQAMDILSAKLAETGKFILLERADIDKINKELKMGGIGHLNIPADYLIVGSISEFGRKETSDVGVFSRVKKQEAYAKVNIRLVEVKTGQIIFSQEAAGEAYSKAGTVMGLGGHAGLDTSLNDKAIDAAISKLVSKVVENLLGKPWRAYVLSYQNGDYIISGGKSQGIRPGDMFTVYKKGQTVVNPQTNMKIELPGAKVGTIRVLSTLGDQPKNEVSLCAAASGVIPTKGFADLYVGANPKM